LARIVNHKNKVIGKAKLKNRKFSYFDTTTIKLPKHKKVKTKKIAVLTSQHTASSGELVAVCFKGKKNTRFFGEATEGKTTNTECTYIKNKLILILSTGFFSDRNKIAYAKNVPVDQTITFDPEMPMSSLTELLNK
jgi:carboxyl-terminal processing protease